MAIIFQKKPAGKAAVPVTTAKKTMNFVNHQSSFNIKKMIPVLAVVVVVMLIFLKVGILDQLQKKTAIMNQIAQKQEQLASVSVVLSEYDELAAQYGRYSYGWMSQAEVGIVDRLQIMNLVEEKIAKLATVENIAINNNALSLNLHGITLAQASDIVEDLETSELVVRAAVYSANAETGREASIYMSIVLTKGEK